MKPNPSSQAAGAASSRTKNATAHSFSTGADVQGKYSVIKANLCNLKDFSLYHSSKKITHCDMTCFAIVQNLLWYDSVASHPPILTSFCPPPFCLHPPSPLLFISISLMNTLQFPAAGTNTVHSIVLFSFLCVYACLSGMHAHSCMRAPCLHVCLTEKAGRRE